MADLLYGFHKLNDNVLRNLAADNIALVNEAGKLALQAHNDAINEMLARLAVTTTQAQQRYTDNARSGELQPLDEYGRAIPRRVPVGTDYTIGLPLIGAGDAVGETYLKRRANTAQNVNDTIADFQNSHLNWLRRQVLSAFFQTGTWIYTDDEYGDLNVVGLANGEANIRYPVMTSAGVKTDNHLLFQTATISDLNNPFPAMVGTLREHPQNTGDVMVFCSAALLPSIQALQTFYEYTDPAITLGIAAERLTATAPTPPFGEVKGYVSGAARVWIVQWDVLNEVGTGNYLIGLTTGGPRPIAKRNPTIAGLGDFGPLDTRHDFPYYEGQYGTFTGFGGWNRVGAVVELIGAPAYVIPTGFERVG